MVWDMGWLGFWLAVIVYFVVGAYNSRKNHEMKHETLRRMLDKGEKIDPALLQALIKPEPKPLMRPSYQGEGYMVLRVVGTLSLFLAPAIIGIIILNHVDKYNTYPGTGIAFLLLMLGAGLHFSARYVTQPPAKPKSQD